MSQVSNFDISLKLLSCALVTCVLCPIVLSKWITAYLNSIVRDQYGIHPGWTVFASMSLVLMLLTSTVPFG